MPQQVPIDRAFFREADNGTTVFFPWGLTHRGYQLTDSSARIKASRAASFLVSATLAIGAWIAYALQPILESESSGWSEAARALAAPGAALAAVILWYASWAARFVENYPESDLVVPREARLREAAELVEPWKIALIGTAVCGLSLFSIWLQPRAWWLGALGALLGIGMLLWSAVLRRAAAQPEGPTPPIA